MMTILLFLIVLSVLVFVHELGHFAVAKWSGMRVDEFGFGFPPKLFGVKRGETEYTINLIPLGGFVRIHGESGEEKNDPQSFASKAMWKRFLVLIAGVAMNLLLAWVLLFGGFLKGLPVALDDVRYDGATVTDAHTQIVYILPDSPADQAGVEQGDTLISVDGTAVLNAEHARELIGAVGQGTEAELIVSREGQEGDVTILVAPQEIEDGMVAIGTQIATVGFARYPFFRAITQGAIATYDLTIATASGFWGIITSLVQGQGPGVDLAGPVGIAAMTGEVAEQGFVFLLYFSALLSVNLAVLNIIPFPALDGGRILFLIIELVRRKPATAKIEGMVHSLGFALLMILVVLITYKDIARIVTG